MSVKNFWHPVKGPTWSETLGKVYTDEMKDHDRHGKLVAQQGKQKKAAAAVTSADKWATSLKNITSIAKFSGTAAKAIDKRKQEEFEVNWSELEAIDRDTISKTIKDDIDLTDDSENILNKLEESGQVSPEALTFLRNNSAGNSLRLRRILGHKTVASGLIDLDSRLEADTTGELQSKYESEVQAGTVDQFYKNDVYAKLKKLGFNDTYIAANFKDEIERIAGVKGVLATLEYRNVAGLGEADKDAEEARNLDLSNDDTKSDNATKYVSRLLKRPGMDKLKVAGFLHRLLKDKSINKDTVRLMQDGTLTKFAAGDKGEYLFDQKTWDYILSGAIEAQETDIAIDLERNESKATEMLAQLYQENSPYQTQEQWNEAIQPLKGHVSNETWANLNNQNKAAQTVKQEQRYLSQYSIDEANGTLDQKIDEIKKIPNYNARKYLLDKATKLKTWKEDPRNATAFDESKIIGQVNTHRTNIAFDKESTLTTDGDDIIAQDLITFKRQDLAKRILDQYKTGEYIENPNIAIEHKDAMQLYKDSNGWGQKGDGKFSLTDDKVGDPKWGNYFNKGVSENYDHNAPLSVDADKNYGNLIKRFPGVTKKERQNKVGGIFSNDQLIGFVKTGTISQDMWYIRGREKGQMSDLIEKGLIALSNSKNPEDKKLVQRFNLKEFQENMPTPDRIIIDKLTKAAENSTDSQQLSRNLVNIFNVYGPEALINSPNLTERIYLTIDKLSGGKEVEQRVEDDERVILERQTKSIIKNKNISKNNQAKAEANETSEGTQSYFRDTESDLTIEEKDDLYTGF